MVSVHVFYVDGGTMFQTQPNKTLCTDATPARSHCARLTMLGAVFCILTVTGCAMPLDGGSAEFEETYTEEYAPPPANITLIFEMPNSSE